MYANIFSCKNKTAIVTGGCGLIGREIVQGLSQYGAKVYIADQNEAAAQNLINENIKYLKLDITSEISVRENLYRVVKDNGKIDILVNCAYPRSDDWGSKFEDIKFIENLKNKRLTFRKLDDFLAEYGNAIPSE